VVLGGRARADRVSVRVRIGHTFRLTVRVGHALCLTVRVCVSLLVAVSVPLPVG